MNKNKQVTDFKNDVLFKYSLGLNDDDSLYLLKMIIESLTDLNCKEINVTNPDLIPDHINDKDMILDIKAITSDGQNIDIEMQNSNLTQQQYQRFQIYGAEMLSSQGKVGDDYKDADPVFQIIFIDDVDKDNLCLMDTYMSRNDFGYIERYNLITRIYIYLPYINIIKDKMNFMEFTQLQKAIYIFKNGITHDIMGIKDKVVEIMKRKVEQFNQDDELRDMAFKRDLQKKARAGEVRDAFDQGKEEGISIGKEEGISIGIERGKQDLVMVLFHGLYPNTDTSFLEGLSALQYDHIANMIANKKSVEEIKDYIENS